jgi:Tfp pilus assembly protein PilE
LLIGVVVIGILATIAIPKFSSMRHESLVSGVTSDLESLASAQRIYLSNNHTYAAAFGDMTEYRGSDDVIITINESTGTGWAATGTHAGLAGAQCGIFIGTASASNASPATTPGSVVCN